MFLLQELQNGELKDGHSAVHRCPLEGVYSHSPIRHQTLQNVQYLNICLLFQYKYLNIFSGINKTTIIWLKFAHHTHIHTDQPNRRALNRRRFCFIGIQHFRCHNEESVLKHTYTHSIYIQAWREMSGLGWKVKSYCLIGILTVLFHLAEIPTPIPQTELVINQTWTAYGGHHKPAWR